MNTDIQIHSKIKVTDKSSIYYKWRGTVSDEILVSERIDGQPKPDVAEFVCALHYGDNAVKTNLKPEQIACVQKKFVDIEHIRETDEDLGNGVIRKNNIGAFEVGDTIQISEKIDGANASIAYNADEDRLEVFSRTNLLNGTDGLRGFKPYIETKFTNDTFKAYPDYVIFGEWCVSHTVQYEKSWYNVWRVYDIYDKQKKKNYLNQTDVKAFCAKYGLDYIHVLYEGPFVSWDHCRSFMNKHTYGDSQEGIVVKNQTKLDNDFIRFPKYLKIVNEKFKEHMQHKGKAKKEIDPEQLKLEAESRAKMETIVTEARVKKQILKCVDEGLVPEQIEPKHIGVIMKNVLKMTYDDICKEEPEVCKSVGALAGKLCSQIASDLVRKIIIGK